MTDSKTKKIDELDVFYQHHQMAGNYPVTEAVERWKMMRAQQAREALAGDKKETG